MSTTDVPLTSDGLCMPFAIVNAHLLPSVSTFGQRQPNLHCGEAGLPGQTLNIPLLGLAAHRAIEKGTHAIKR
jgi:hypothetical protein